jgi:cobalt-zinc-cadmium efflux system outer membrane protein
MHSTYRLLNPLWIALICGFVYVIPAQARDTTDFLTLERIHELVERHNPELASSREDLKAKEGSKLQTSLRPNPTLQAEGENFGGSGQFEGRQRLEQKFVLRYMIETWNKRSFREDVAGDEVDLASLTVDATRQDVLAEAEKAYWSVLASRELLNLREELKHLADTGLRTVSRQEEAGKVSSLEKTKAEVEQSRTRIAVRKAQRNFQSARHTLASKWGENSLDNRSISGDLEMPDPPASFGSFAKRLDNNPVVELAKEAIDQQKSSLELAKARRYPNITVGGGYKQVESTDDYSYIVNVSLPIPLFDQNQGSVQQQKNKIDSARQRLISTRTELRARLRSRYETLKATYEELKALDQEVLPGASRAFEASLKGFRSGKFDYLEVLDAQRTLFENRVQFVRSLEIYHRTRTEIDRLTGSISTSKNQTTKEREDS